MTVYQIQNWDSLFENNKSRERDQCHFVCVPNKQDGMGLTRLLSLPNGTAVYGIFHLILGACSRQRRPRAGWMTDDGQQTGTAWAPAEMAFSGSSLSRLTDHLKPIKCPPSARQVPAKCPLSV